MLQSQVQRSFLVIYILANLVSAPATDGMSESLELELVKNLFCHESELFADDRMDSVQRVSPIVRVRSCTRVDFLSGEFVEVVVFAVVARSIEKAEVPFEAGVCVDAVGEGVVEDLLAEFSWDCEEVWWSFRFGILSRGGS